MSDLFEDFTYPLTDYEREKLLPAFIISFHYRQGLAKAITNREIIEKMAPRFDQPGSKLTDARVRKIINHIRVNNLMPGLVASSKGYYVSNDPKEVQDYIDSLSGRIISISAVRSSMIRYLQTLTK